MDCSLSNYGLKLVALKANIYDEYHAFLILRIFQLCSFFNAKMALF
jgi:hypothetical protein